MTQTIQTHFRATYHYELPPELIHSIPLSGGGTILERLSLLSSLLVPSHSLVSQASHIFITTHSQGTPVSLLLLSSLIESGVIKPNQQRVTVLAMAGISHGPWPWLKTNLVMKYIEQDAGRELFEMCDSNSQIGRAYTQAIEYVLSRGVRMVACGSWFDQVVPVS